MHPRTLAAPQPKARLARYLPPTTFTGCPSTTRWNTTTPMSNLASTSRTLSSICRSASGTSLAQTTTQATRARRWVRHTIPVSTGSSSRRSRSTLTRWSGRTPSWYGWSSSNPTTKSRRSFSPRTPGEARFGAGSGVRAFTFHDAAGDVGVPIDGGIRLGILLSRLEDDSDSAVGALHGSEASGSPNETYNDASDDFRSG